ncbi:MAG: extracellular solute-binding protein [Erysipelotrichaceae bacterium]|nr:extracellular solute-binding protein [Erysipelotrichaceae bacterium]
MLNKKLGIMALSLAAMGLASCGGNGGGEPVIDLSQGDSITYWCPNTDTEFFTKKVAEFKAAHPEFKGDITFLATMGEGEVKGELTKDPENSADVFEIADDNIPDCVTARAMTAFDSSDVDVMKNRYGDEAVKASSVKSKVYGVPYRNDNGYVLSYDTSIVSAEEAKTLEGIIAACKRAGATFNFDLTNSWYTFAPIWAAGGKTYTDDQGVFHSEIATDAIATVAAGFANIVKDAGSTWNHVADDANFGASTAPIGAVVLWNDENKQAEKIGDRLAITTLPSFTVGGKSYALKSFQGFKALGMRRASNFTDAKKITARAFCLFMGSDAVAKDRLTQLKQGVSNKAVIEQKNLWQSKWLAALGAQQAAGNTVSQANGSSGTFWSAAEALGNAIKGGTLTTKEAMLEALRICETTQNTPQN